MSSEMNSTLLQKIQHNRNTVDTRIRNLQTELDINITTLFKSSNARINNQTTVINEKVMALNSKILNQNSSLNAKIDHNQDGLNNFI